MSKLGIGLGGIIAYAGRSIFTAHYGRMVQGATDPYIKYVGGGFLAIIATIILNFTCVMLKLYSVQTVLAVALPFVAFYFLLAPKIAIPAIAVATANTAATPGDQPNVWLVRDGAKTLASFMAIGLFWIEAYILTTMLAPFDLYPVFFMVLHIPLIMVLLTLMTGRVKVSPELYNRAFWVSTTLVLVGVLVVFAFKEQLGPRWAEITASRSSRVEASNATLSIRKADQARADWEERYVRISDTGFQVVCINKQNKLVPKHIICEEGAMRVDDAAPYKAAQDALKKEAIRRVTGKSDTNEGKDAAAQGGNPGSVQFKMLDPSTWVPWAVANPVYALVLLVGHVLGIWLIKWLWNKNETTASSNTKTIVVKSAPSKPWLAYILIAAGIGGAFYFYATQTSSGYAVTRNIVGSEDRVTQEDLRHPSTVKYVRARITNPDHPYVGKPLDVQVGAGFTQRFEMNRRVDPDDNSTIIVAPNKNFYVLRQTGMDKGANLVFGNWENTSSGVTGAYTIAPNPETGLLTATLAANGTKIQMEFKRFFQ